MFENYYSFFHYCLLSCRYAMLRKRFLNEPKWGGTTSLGGDGAPGLTIATAMATSPKNDTSVATFVNSRQKTTKPYFEPGLQIRS